MGERLELHEELLQYTNNLYFQPPSSIKLEYPCIIYNKTGKSKRFGNDGLYFIKQGYKLIVIDRDPDSEIADNIEQDFQYCTIDQHYTMDNLNHTSLTLYY